MTLPFLIRFCDPADFTGSVLPDAFHLPRLKPLCISGPRPVHI
jgi:hypothetical protein